MLLTEQHLKLIKYVTLLIWHFCLSCGFTLSQVACSFFHLHTGKQLHFRKKNIAPFIALSYCYSLLLQARERQRREEQERHEREAAEAERKRKEEEEACERAAREAEEKEAALAKMRHEKALSLGAEPEKGPDVTQVLTRTFLFFMLFLCC